MIKILAMLLIVSFNTQADSNIKDKLSCTADVVTTAAMVMLFAKNTNDEKLQGNVTKEADVWHKSISKRLEILGKTPEEIDVIFKQALNESWDRHRKVLDNVSPDNFVKNFTDNILPLRQGCKDKYSSGTDINL